MSVYTAVNQQQLKNFLSHYSLGSLVDFSGIHTGIDNSNYAVETSQGKFILTIFETLTIEEIPCYLSLLNHLGEQEFPSPIPQSATNKSFIHTLQNKPAALFNCLPGSSIEAPSINQCTEVGEYLAKLHLLSKNTNFQQVNPKDINGCQSIFERISPYLSQDEITLLGSELNYQLNVSLPNIPQGIIHADLFKDNVLFQQEQMTGMLDFYNACTDYYIFDIAVACNDWCADGAMINQKKLAAFLSGYNKVRTLSTDEIDCLNVFLRRAALRFCLSRLDHQFFPKEGELTLSKDPGVFRHLLEYHIFSAGAAA